jgi:hypothetical protein
MGGAGSEHAPPVQIASPVGERRTSSTPSGWCRSLSLTPPPAFTSAGWPATFVRADLSDCGHGGGGTTGGHAAALHRSRLGWVCRRSACCWNSKHCHDESQGDLSGTVALPHEMCQSCSNVLELMGHRRMRARDCMLCATGVGLRCELPKRKPPAPLLVVGEPKSMLTPSYRGYQYSVERNTADVAVTAQPPSALARTTRRARCTQC